MLIGTSGVQKIEFGEDSNIFPSLKSGSRSKLGLPVILRHDNWSNEQKKVP